MHLLGVHLLGGSSVNETGVYNKPKSHDIFELPKSPFIIPIIAI